MEYSWIKDAHMLAVIVFVLGLLINGGLLLFVRAGSLQADRILTLARRLNGPVVGSALVLVWILGLTLAYMGGFFADTWLSIKMLLVLVLSGMHGMQSAAFRKMLQSPGTPPSIVMRLSALITIVFVVLIMVLVIAKPF